MPSLMNKPIVAHAVTTVHASIANVWKALIDPAAIKQYFFGATVSSDWKAGSPITWKGEWQGKPYEDKGVILQVEPRHLLQYTHYSPLSGQPDTPENYHTVTIELCEEPDGTRVSLAQDNNPTEEAREHSEKNWSMMLAGLKKLVEE
jgi:uncharacterized protein YndB with AHSA1/START domain